MRKSKNDAAFTVMNQFFANKKSLNIQLILKFTLNFKTYLIRKTAPNRKY